MRLLLVMRAGDVLRCVVRSIYLALKYHDMWLDTWKKDKKEPESIDPEYHRTYLTALFMKARLHSKLFSADIKVLDAALGVSLDLYQKVIELVAKWKVTTFDEETELCKEMLQLLPLKRERIRAGQITGY